MALLEQITILQGADVDEDVISPSIRRDEAKSFIRVEKLNLARRHWPPRFMMNGMNTPSRLVLIDQVDMLLRLALGMRRENRLFLPRESGAPSCVPRHDGVFAQNREDASHIVGHATIEDRVMQFPS
ncbi:hypothetical protein FHT28_006922 [Rhizobium sp. SG570]|nr:hypothetical protein [Rhizobium sp. SG570]